MPDGQPADPVRLADSVSRSPSRPLSAPASKAVAHQGPELPLLGRPQTFRGRLVNYRRAPHLQPLQRAERFGDCLHVNSSFVEAASCLGVALWDTSARSGRIISDAARSGNERR